MDDAACQGVPTAAFFPAGAGGVPASIDAEYAKRVCAGCPVKSQCLTHALTFREDYGVWGGLDEHERAELLRRARREAENQRRRERAKEKADAATAA
ncbi:WhiB family transcriptional regulator [Streptomyces sp. AJS327]|nr:WhiB family transcriptional regulator [Streptomyces sp. AJS327]